MAIGQRDLLALAFPSIFGIGLQSQTLLKSEGTSPPTNTVPLAEAKQPTMSTFLIICSKFVQIVVFKI